MTTTATTFDIRNQLALIEKRTMHARIAMAQGTGNDVAAAAALVTAAALELEEMINS